MTLSFVLTPFSNRLEPKEFGLIMSKGNTKYSFVFRNMINLCPSEVILRQGLKVRLSVDKSNNTRSPSSSIFLDFTRKLVLLIQCLLSLLCLKLHC